MFVGIGTAGPDPAAAIRAPNPSVISAIVRRFRVGKSKQKAVAADLMHYFCHRIRNPIDRSHKIDGQAAAGIVGDGLA